MTPGWDQGDAVSHGKHHSAAPSSGLAKRQKERERVFAGYVMADLSFMETDQLVVISLP